MSDSIQFSKVSKWFETAAGRFEALRDINLSISRGEHVAIVGKSGSGKSTLLNMLTGIDHPSRGTVTINGTAVHELNESRLASWRGAHVGIVFQFFQLIPTLSISENVLMAMDFVNVIPRKERRDRTRSLLELVGISRQENKLPGALSGGEQQRAAIARALANDPPILVADEPTGNLDSKTTDVVRALFTDLVGAGKTVIVVTHDRIAEGEYGRIITVSDGAVSDDTRRI